MSKIGCQWNIFFVVEEKIQDQINEFTREMKKNQH